MLYLLAVILISSWISFVLVLYLWAKKAFSYWKWKKVPYLEPESLIFGHYYDVITGKVTPGEYFRTAYDKLTSGRWGGLYIFWKPLLLVRDLDVVKDVLRNTNYFDRSSSMVNPKRPLTRHLFNLSGAEWKAMRNAVLPAFSPAKMKIAFELVKENSVELIKVVDEEIRTNNVADMVDLSERYCIDVMTSFIFGLRVNTLGNANSFFRQIANKQSKPNMFTAVLKEVCPELINVLNISSIDAGVEQFFYSLVSEAIQLKMDSEQAFHHDFISVMLKLKHRKPSQNGEIHLLDEKNHEDLIFYKTFEDFDEQLMSAQCFIMFMAGFKPTSFLMNCLWLEVAKNRRVQEKIQEEIDLVLSKYNQEIPLESLYEMTYTDQVISEAIRLHPVSPVLFRTCIQDYPVPNTDFIIEKGTEIVIPVYGIHHDSRYYCSPEEFNPDHFSRSSQASKPAGSFVSFGEGPRQCLAMRLSSIMVKFALITMLHKYSISLSPNMSPSTLRFKKYLKVMKFNSSILLHCVPRHLDISKS